MTTATSIEGKIFERLKEVLAGLSWVNTIEYQLIRVLPNGFADHELPAIQFFDNRAAVKHARGDIDVEWSISIELVMKTSTQGAVSQLDLFDRKQEIEDLIGANVDLTVPGVIHLRYDGWETDMHTSDPYFICRLDFSVLYKKSFTGC